MMKITIHQQRDVISQYLYAKDHNRPHLMASAFTSDARLGMQVKTKNITFPGESIGRDAITQTLVSHFGRQYENVYTFFLSEALNSEVDSASCNWLVVMTEKGGGKVRVGFGRYDWHFGNELPLRADHLLIVIDEMQVLEPSYAPDILGWASALPYPWCEVSVMLEAMPELEQLTPINYSLRNMSSSSSQKVTSVMV